jgi:hypothetical protein
MGSIVSPDSPMKPYALNATRPSSQLTHGALTRHFVGRVKRAIDELGVLIRRVVDVVMG